MTPSSLVIVTVASISFEVNDSGAKIENCCVLWSSLDIVNVLVVGVICQPSGRLSANSMLNESSPFPVFVRVNENVPVPPGETPVSVTALDISKPYVCGIFTTISLVFDNPESVLTSNVTVCPSSRLKEELTFGNKILALTTVCCSVCSSSSLSPIPSVNSDSDTQFVPLNTCTSHKSESIALLTLPDIVKTSDTSVPR